MTEKRDGCLSIAVLFGCLILCYFLFVFDYKSHEFTWLDSIFGICAMFLVFGGISKLSSGDDNASPEVKSPINSDEIVKPDSEGKIKRKRSGILDIMKERKKQAALKQSNISSIKPDDNTIPPNE